MATHHSLSTSRPSKLQPKLPAKASISRISAVASTSTGAQTKSRTSPTKTLKYKQLELDVIPTRAAPPVPASPTKKRARKDTLDENGSSGDAVERPHRVRQRLISTSSVVTIRPRKSIEDARPVKGTSAALSCVSTDSITPSEVLPRARPLSEINHSPGHTPHRRLRRVGTIEFPTMHGPVSDISNQPSRAPIPVLPATFTRHSTPDFGASEHARSSSQCTPRHARHSSSSSSSSSSLSYVASASPGPAPRVSLDRFDLRIAPTKMHTELWDLDDECVALFWCYDLSLHTKVVDAHEAHCTHGRGFLF